jgi:hypothetical protein
MNSIGTLQEAPPGYAWVRPDDDAPASKEIQQMAHAAVKAFHECFWWWDAEAAIESRGEVRAVIRVLRMAGGHRAWWTAQRISKCL